MRRIAVVEDNADNRLLIEAFLADQYDIAAYADGPEALEGMRAVPPELVLLDISLPLMPGEEVLRVMRLDESLRSVPVVAVTAHAMPGDREHFLAVGFDDYLSKPIDHRLLCASVERWLGR